MDFLFKIAIGSPRNSQLIAQLASRSRVFERMSFGDPKGRSIEIIVVFARSFAELLHMIHSFYFELTVYNIPDVLIPIDKYSVIDLLPVCTAFLAKT